MPDDSDRTPVADLDEHDEGPSLDDRISQLDLEPMPDDADLENISATDLDPVTTDDAFRAATLDLLDGRTTVDEWLDVAARAINKKVDIPWVPEALEQALFTHALRFSAKMLHGLLTNGTANATTDG